MNMLSRDIKRIADSGLFKYAFTNRLMFASILAGLLAITLFVSPFSRIACAQEKPANAGAAGTSLEEERLKILKADIQSQIEQLKKLKQELEQEKKGLEGKRKEQLVKVVKMYESMPAEEAAKAIEKLDDDTAILILTSLKPRTAGKVLGQIESARAASLSKKALQKYR